MILLVVIVSLVGCSVPQRDETLSFDGTLPLSSFDIRPSSLDTAQMHHIDQDIGVLTHTLDQDLLGAQTYLDQGTDLGVQSHCTNQHFDGDETDVDCGGAICTPCDNQFRCIVDSDCISNICSDCAFGQCGGPRLCVSCSDGIMNGDESDTDCGGWCVGCPRGKRCFLYSVVLPHHQGYDCLSRSCSAWPDGQGNFIWRCD